MHDRFFVVTVLRNHICCFLGFFATFEQQLIVSEEDKVDTLEEHNRKKTAFIIIYSAVILINLIPSYKESKCTICPKIIYIYSRWFQYSGITVFSSRALQILSWCQHSIRPQIPKVYRV